ncbi:TIR domain-containing protein [Brevibacterium sp. VCM10]|uniref:TIR domain-containing protein n=1 Tax=Brevibacterium sp. VCM10 TaxID=1381751 RepID=UPI0009DD3AAB|nr:TIR domain-containing protein [Brevibacterium sp. VCM10]
MAEKPDVVPAEADSIDHDFDIVVSFAGEDRELVAELVDKCKSKGYSVFYDEDEVASLWGEELTEYFANVYENRSRAAIMFISEYYADKPWTTHERRSILVRALGQAANRSSPYVFPIRIDDTDLPGLRSSVSYVDSRKYSVDEIVTFIEKKIGAPMNPPKPVIDRTPLTAEECGSLLSERPPGWEYFYTAYLLVEAVKARREELRDARNGFFHPGEYIEPERILELSTQEISRLFGIMDAFDGLFNERAQSEAWGDPGEPGDTETIEYMADRYGRLIDMLLQWSKRVGGYSTLTAEARAYLRALTKYVEQPIESLTSFPHTFRNEVNRIPVALEQGEAIELTLTVEWTVPPETSDKLELARVALDKSIT